MGWDHRLPNSLPSGHPYVYLTLGDEAREGGCAERNLCRAGSTAGIARRASRQCPPSLARCLVAAAERPRQFSNRASRFRRGRHACHRNPRAPYTAPQAAVDTTGEFERPVGCITPQRRSRRLFALSIRYGSVHRKSMGNKFFFLCA